MKNVVKLVLSLFVMITLIPLIALFLSQKQNKFTLYDEHLNKELHVSKKEYVIGAVASEMPVTFHSEALKAQAAAVYTNAVRLSAQNKNVANINSQKNSGYISKKKLKEIWGKNFDAYYEKISSAVDETFGSIISYDGKPILAAYHSMSSGKTQRAEDVWEEAVPYLVSVNSEGDTFCSDFESKVSFSTENAREILKNEFPDTYLPEINSLLITDRIENDSGAVLSVMVGDKTVSGQKIRELFNLRSAAFTYEIADGFINFAVKGYGHGVGLSQYGADFMARQGSKWQDIVSHYYSGTQILYTTE